MPLKTIHCLVCAWIVIVSSQSYADPRFVDFWPGVKRGLLEFSAQSIGVFPDHDFYGVQRDGAWFIYALKFAAADEPDLMPRLHYIDVSFDSRKTIHFQDYLREIIDGRELAAGKKILLIDTGWSGGILKEIRRGFPENPMQIEGLFSASNNTEIMVSRIFQVFAYGQSSIQRNPADLLLDTHRIETHLPKSQGRVERYEYTRNKWRPVLYERNDTHLDGTIDPELHRKYREDLGQYMSLSENRLMLRSRIALWRELRELAKTNNIELLKNRLSTILAERKDYSEALVRDFVDFFPDKLTLSGVGLAKIDGQYQRGSCEGSLDYFKSLKER